MSIKEPSPDWPGDSIVPRFPIQSTESSAFLLTIESASVTMSSMNMTFAVSVPNCLELLGNLSYSFFLSQSGDGSLCSETSIVFSFPGRAEALPGVGFS